MVDVIPTGLALLAVVLFVVALLAMTIGRLAVAGVSFFSASIVIFLREKRLNSEDLI